MKSLLKIQHSKCEANTKMISKKLGVKHGWELKNIILTLKQINTFFLHLFFRSHVL